MNIKSDSNIRNNLQKHNYASTNFRAIQLAKYQPTNEQSSTVYKLETKDLPFIDKFERNIDEYYKEKKITDPTTQEIMTNAFEVSKEILNKDSNQLSKSEILLSVSDSNPCGILIGNILKRGENNTYSYSSREKPNNNETEIDLLVTWNPFQDKKPYKTGKILTTEYFNRLKNNQFEDVYVRSEIPELSFATDFYKTMGFEKADKRQTINNSSHYRYVIDKYNNDSEDEIIPMLAKKADIKNRINDVSQTYNRNDLDNISIDLESIIE